VGRFVSDKKELAAALDKERAAKRTIVFTNGVFDLLHAGHVASLKGARSLGDVLVVGVNDDESVKRLKGDKRPIVPLAQRAEVIAALASVDYVTAFSEDTPAKLIEAVRPDVLAKGQDYAGKEVVGADFVKKNGGRVELIPLVAGISTTDLVTEILRRYRD
jgi:D-beta-D-heptose 7-phosphate kinase/D-beta-D-heptose 1-phosphate adenosyltransferase